ncbi:OmpA family protein [Limisalsivibrio acetivorans]|uniref:OmpA family protein n=1 Tax=Limisalsivibrio acetivorans TaxID=1304888 RepID=UPI0003B635F7|nr:OmpA family protein [Limisalsivibrio acetivorans]
MGKKKCPECEKGAPKWMATFTDMNMLLLTFFVLLLAMSSMDKRKIKEALGSLQGSMGILQHGSKTEMTAEDIVSRISFVDTKNNVQTKTIATIKSYVKSANLSKVVTVVETKKGVSVRIMDSVLFGPGSAELRPEARPLLSKLSAVIESSPYNALVEGHTDDTPSRSARFPSNWELSTARAVSVVKFMIDQGVNPQTLAASGYGEYHPLLPNITQENRAKNRRVEVNLVSPELSESRKNIFEDENTEEDGGF